MWSSDTGKCFHTFRGHTAEIVCLSFNPQSTLVATGSMDTTAKLWDVHSGHEVATLAVDYVIQCSLVIIYFRDILLKLFVCHLIRLENPFSLVHLITQYLYGMLLLESEGYNISRHVMYW